MDWLRWIVKIVQIWHSPSPEDLSTRSLALSRHLLLVGLMMLTLGYGTGVQAEVVSDRPGDLWVAANPDAANPDAANPDRLAIPSSAADVPLGAADQSWENLPPPEQPAADGLPIAETAPEVSPEASPEVAPEVAPLAVSLLQTLKAETAAKPIELAFGLPPQAPSQPPTAIPAPIPVPISETTAPGVNAVLATLFVGNSDSLVAKAVGSAEGTRTPEGDRNPAYFGHVDPGNKAWNLGSFSYQHEAVTPEDADAKQLTRLEDQASIMQAKAQAKGMSLTLEEALNGIDLANQAPKAVLDQDGYIDWLAAAHQKGLSGDDAVLWARTQSFFDPNLQRWNAPGLGNTQESINHDQERRMQAIDRAIAVHGQPVPSTVQPQPLPQPSPQAAAQPSLHKISEDIGIARLFAEQTITHFKESTPSQDSSSELTQPGSAPWSAPGLAAAPERQAIAPSNPATVALPQSPGIAALFNLDLPRS